MPRRLRNRTAQRWFNARHTCSAVTSGFFPPQPLRMEGDKSQDDQRQRQMADQSDIVPAFEVHQPGFLFPQAE